MQGSLLNQIHPAELNYRYLGICGFKFTAVLFLRPTPLTDLRHQIADSHQQRLQSPLKVFSVREKFTTVAR